MRKAARTVLFIVIVTAGLALSVAPVAAEQIGPGGSAPVAEQVGPGGS